MPREPFAAVVALLELVALDHRPHRAVEDEDSALQLFVEQIGRRHGVLFRPARAAARALRAAAGFTPRATSTVKGSPVRRAPTLTAMSRNPAPVNKSRSI